MKNRHTDIKECIHCGKCQEHCLFLKKYQIDIGDEEKLKELAYHCFLCGTCTEVCPKGIDGRECVLKLRRERVMQDGGVLRDKGYGMLLTEKRNYLFRNYRHATSGSVLFPGCNFPSFYPKTMKKLVRLFWEREEIGVVYDCCGKPLSELGLYDLEEKIVRRIEREFRERGITEAIMVCPNCYYFLKPRLSVRVVSIYEKLAELGTGQKIAGGRKIYCPCPDRENREWLRQIELFMEESCEMLGQLQCCGLGGCAAIKESGLARGMTEGIEKDRGMYVYCASCAGNFARSGCKDVRHVLAEILRTEEYPDTGKSLFNRMKTKFI